MGLTMFPEQQQQLGFGIPGANPMTGNMMGFGTPVPMSVNPANISMPAPVATSPISPMGMTMGTPLTAGGGSLLPPGAGDPAGAGGGWFEGIGGLEGIGSIASGLGQLGQVYGALLGVKLAKDQLAFSKESYATNLANQTQHKIEKTILEHPAQDLEKSKAKATLLHYQYYSNNHNDS